jgi:hypothetical protein
MNLGPHYDLAEINNPEENLEWRLRIWRAALKDNEVQKVVRESCFNDVLFFLSFAGWLIEPRGEPKVLPFLVWPHQVDAVLTLVRSIREATSEQPIDVIFDKSRGQGATWICLWVLIWFWLKDQMFAGGVISRNMEAVDKKNYHGSLFPRLDWSISMLPYWLLPKSFNAKRDRSQSDHTWSNVELGGVLAGTACTPEAFSGDRLTAAFCDEVAKIEHQNFEDMANSIAHVTNTRWFVSTHLGDSGPFFDMVFGETWEVLGQAHGMGGSGVYRNAAGSYKVILDWRDNPAQNRLAYRFVGGQFMAERESERDDVALYIAKLRTNGNWTRLMRRGFVKEGRLRSAWYDRKCLARDATPRNIAQDVDRDPRSTVGKLFNPEVMDQVERCHVRPPVWQGDIAIRDKLRFFACEEGPLKIWFRADGHPPRGKYVLGGDPASGIVGPDTANSALIGGNAETGEQVLEYIAQVPESRFADIAVALAQWLHDALLIWEGMGPYGKRFSVRVANELGYWNIWRRPVYASSHVRTLNLGWSNNQARDKRDLFEDFWLGMQDDEFIPRSKELIAECRGWEERPSKTPGKTEIVYHGTGHGDRAIAGGLCYKGMKEISAQSEKGLDKEKDDDHAILEWSLAGRQSRRAEAQRQREAEDDDFAGFSRVARAGWR